jgi:L-fucose dehydrogenase
MDLGFSDKLIILATNRKSPDTNLIRVLHDEGATVVIIGRGLPRNPNLLTEIGDLDEKVLFVETELTDSSNCEKVVREIFDKYGRIDGLVNYSEPDDLVSGETDEQEKFSKSLQEQLSRVFLITHFALPFLKVSKGPILNIHTERTDGIRSHQLHAAVGGGIDALTREWAVELLKYGIRINSIIKKTNTIEVGELTAFLLSEKSSHTTGQLIRINKE